MNEHIKRVDGRRTEDITVRDANAMLRAANIRLREANTALLTALERFKKAQWSDAPKTVKWRDGMMVATVCLPMEETLTMYAHKDALGILATTGGKDGGNA